MAHAFHQLYYHFAWSTARREPAIERTWRPKMLEILNDEVKKRGGWPVRHNAMHDHVHLLVRLAPKGNVSEFIGEVKGATSYRVNHELKPSRGLYWQEGYGVLTLRKDELERVARYIDGQEEHHRSGRLSVLLETTETEEDDWPERNSASP
jgi:putative transposase